MVTLGGEKQGDHIEARHWKSPSCVVAGRARFSFYIIKNN